MDSGYHKGLKIPSSGIIHYIDDYHIIYSINSVLIVRSGTQVRKKRLSFLIGPSILFRVLRAGIHKVILHENKLFVIVDQKIIILCFETLKVIASTKLRAKRPLCIEKYKDGIVYGEYFSNPERRPVNIIHVNEGGSEHVLAEINNIRHIHSIVYCDYIKRYLVCTGDSDNESKILAFDKDFYNYEKVLYENQKYRVVQPVCVKNKLFFGSDIPDRLNSIYEYNFDTKILIELGTVPGPIFFSLRKGKFIYFSTVVEPSSINDQNTVFIFRIDLYGNIKQIFEAQKDIVPMKLGQYGQIIFPRFDLSSSNELCFTEFSTKNHLRIGTYNAS